MSSNPRRRPEPRPAEAKTGERLQKVLAAAGVASRRASEEMIAAGRVRVDGRVVRVMGTRVDTATARVEVDGERIDVNPRHEYVVLNKPAGVVTTASDPHGRPTVLDFVRTGRRVYPVGRLDAETTGLLLMTNHGELAHRLTHPRYQIPRTYVAEVKGTPAAAAMRRLLTGVTLEDGPARAKAARVVRRSSGRSHVQITMTEGRKHEVRRLLEAIGFPAVGLARVSFGPITLGTLALGKTRRLDPAEVGKLLRAAGL